MNKGGRRCERMGRIAGKGVVLNDYCALRRTGSQDSQGRRRRRGEGKVRLRFLNTRIVNAGGRGKGNEHE